MTRISVLKAITAISDTLALAGQDQGPHVAMAVVDSRGTLIAFAAMDQTPERVIPIAQAKAYTAARMRIPTVDFRRRLKEEDLALNWFCDPQLSPLPGGIPLQKDGRFIGAVGISGRTLDEDVRLAQTLAAMF